MAVKGHDSRADMEPQCHPSKRVPGQLLLTARPGTLCLQISCLLTQRLSLEITIILKRLFLEVFIKME